MAAPAPDFDELDNARQALHHAEMAYFAAGPDEVDQRMGEAFNALEEYRSIETSHLRHEAPDG